MPAARSPAGHFMTNLAIFFFPCNRARPFGVKNRCGEASVTLPFRPIGSPETLFYYFFRIKFVLLKN